MASHVTWLLICVSLFVVISFANAIPSVTREGPGYLLSCVGDCSRNTQPPVKSTKAGLAMIGGAVYPPDVGVAGYHIFGWLSARSGNGSFVVLKCVEPEDVGDCPTYNEFIYSLGFVRSVTTLCFTSPDGSNQDEVYNVLSSAGGVFFTGGDQYKYVTWWNNTRVSTAINQLIANGRPFGGSSAGLAIQGEFVYTAANGSVTSSEALRFPFNPLITLTNEFWRFPYMKSIVTDTHFYQRDRMGRLVTFMGRVLTSNWATKVLGVGVSERTAVLVDENGIGKVVGDGPAYFISSQQSSQLECTRTAPLTFTKLNVNKYESVERNRGMIFNFNTWQASGGSTYLLSAVNGNLTSTQPNGSIY